MRVKQKTKRVPRTADIGKFLHFWSARQPVIVSGAARLMPAYTRWSNEHLRAEFKGGKPMVRFEDGTVAFVSSDTLFDYLEAPSSFQSSHGLMYLTDFYLKPSFGDFRRERLAAAAAFPLSRGSGFVEWTSLYAGPAGTRSEYHQDVFSTHTWLAALRGSKRWWICPPNAPSTLNAARKKGDVIEAVIDAGDLIYLPPNWWHEVENVTDTLAVSGNFCTLDQAHTAFDEARRSESPNREVWVRTWTEILRSQSAAAW